MKKIFLFCMVFALTLALGFGSALAGPSSKFAAQVSSVALVPATNNLAWAKVLETTIKTPNKKDLLIGASFETGLYTKTVVKSSLGVQDTTTATAGITIKVLIDGVTLAQPGEVIFDKRAQTLTAKLGGILETCEDLNGDGIIDIGTECTFTDEEIGLILDTMAAHHFNFIVANLTPGNHTVTVWAKIETFTDKTVPDLADAKALVGKGSLTVEEVRATNSPDGIVFLE